MNEHGTEAGTARATVRPKIKVRPQRLDSSGPGRDAIRSATLDVKAPTQQLLRINHAPSPLPAPVVVELRRAVLSVGATTRVELSTCFSAHTSVAVETPVPIGRGRVFHPYRAPEQLPPV